MLDWNHRNLRSNFSDRVVTGGRASSLAVACLLAAALAGPARADVLFSTATADATNNNGFTISSQQVVGSVFHLDSTVTIEQVGGYIGVHSTEGPQGSELFFEIVPVTGDPALPIGGPNDQTPLAYVEFTRSDFAVPLLVTLPPGDYALVVGSVSGDFSVMPVTSTATADFINHIFGNTVANEWGYELSQPMRFFAYYGCGNGTLAEPEECDDSNTMSGDGCSFDCRLEICGDGKLDVGEECDDGNTAGGDCCAADCTVPSTDTCTSAAVGLLKLVDAADDAKDKLVWNWKKGGATDIADFGMPDSTTSYHMCIVPTSMEAGAGTADLSLSADVAWSGGTKDWKLKYKTSHSKFSGVTNVLAKPGAEGKSRILVKGSGTALPDIAVGTAGSVTVTLRSSDDQCWTSGALTITKARKGKVLAK